MRILTITTVSNTANRFLVPHLRALREEGHTVDLACSLTDPVHKDALASVTDEFFDVSLNRSPLSLGNLKALSQLVRLSRSRKYDVIHVHTPVAAAVGRLVALLAGTPFVIYTAHGFHFFRGASPVAWAVWFPIEWALSFATDLLHTMNFEDFNLARRWFKHPTVQKVPGIGFKAQAPSRSPGIALREELGLDRPARIILSVGELNENKGHQVVIEALPLMDSDFQYVLAGRGPKRERLQALADSLGVSDRVHFLGYRSDVPSLLASAQVLAHPSYREGLPVAIMEALDRGVPVVGAKIRGITDLVSDESGVLVVGRNPSDWSEAIEFAVSQRDQLAGGPASVEGYAVEIAVASVISDYRRIQQVLADRRSCSQ